MTGRPPRSVQLYVGVVIAAGTAVLVWAFAAGHVTIAADHPTLWVFAAFLLAGEFFFISIPHGDEVDEITISTTFTFAILIAFGTGPVVVAQALASVISDGIKRKTPWKVAFNAGQYAVAVGASGAVYAALGGPDVVSPASLLPFLAAGVVFYVVNNALTDVGIGLSIHVPLVGYLIRDLRAQFFATPTLLALAPVVVAASGVTLWLVPLAAVPAFAVYWATRLGMENTRLVGELQGSLARMTELNRMKDDFVAVVSHELRTPLTSIQGYIKTLLQLSPGLEEEQRRSFLEAADRQSERLRRLIEQLLVVSRLESHVEPLVWQRVSLARVTAHVVDELRPRAHGHTFDLRFPAELPEVETDESKLHQILSNLVENALKYSPPDTRITVRGEPSVEGVFITIEDEGGGIPEDARERVFERFYQVDSSHTRRQGGTGLGLYICRKMAEAIDARIWLARSDGDGSEFCVFVPERHRGRDDTGGGEPGASAGADQSITASV
jgi:signal transduction histidine kinase